MARTSKTTVKETDPGPGIPMEEKAGQVMLWALNEIRDNPYQPRVPEDPEDPKFLEIADSIEQHGLLQIPTGRVHEGSYQMGDGHRRLRVFRYLREKHKEDLMAPKWDYMPVFVQSMTDQEMADLVFESNEKRRDLNAIELAKLTKQYIEEFEISAAEMARRRGVSQGALANTLRLLDLPAAVQSMVLSGELPSTHARELVRLKDDAALCIELAKEAVNRDLTVRTVSGQVHNALTRKWRPLHSNDYPSPRWKAATICKDCTSRETLPHWRSGKDEPYCTDIKCWDKKQAEAEVRAREKAQKEAEKAGQGDVLDAHKLGFQTYERWNKDTILDPKACKDCDKKKQARYGSADHGNPFPVCLDTACYRKKKTAKTRQVNKLAEEKRAKLLTLAEKQTGGAIYGRLPRAVLLFILDQLLSHDVARAMAKLRDISTKQDSCVGQGSIWKTTLYKQITEEDNEALRWTVTEVLMLKQVELDKQQYYGEQNHLARFVGALEPEAYAQEFGGPPPVSADKMFPRLSDSLFTAPAESPAAESPAEPPDGAATGKTLVEIFAPEAADILVEAIDVLGSGGLSPTDTERCITVLDAMADEETEASMDEADEEAEREGKDAMDAADRQRELAQQGMDVQDEVEIGGPVEVNTGAQDSGAIDPVFGESLKAGTQARASRLPAALPEEERRTCILRHLPGDLPCHVCNKVLDCLCQAFYHDETGEFHCDEQVGLTV